MVKAEERRGEWRTLGSADHEREKETKHREGVREIGKERNMSDGQRGRERRKGLPEERRDEIVKGMYLTFVQEFHKYSSARYKGTHYSTSNPLQKMYVTTSHLLAVTYSSSYWLSLTFHTFHLSKPSI